jgi:membrane dipeptidase
MKTSLALTLSLGALAAPALAAAQSAEQRVERVLRTTPIIDGHNDLPIEIRDAYDHWRRPLELDADTSKLERPLQTDLPRLRKGHVGAQFWSVWIPATLKGPEAVQTTLEQIDIVHRMVARYPNRLELASTAKDVSRIQKKGRIASLIGVEGGHQIGNSPAALRQFYSLGVRYMTLTHSLTNDFADSATDDPKHGGLTTFGRAIVGEMNRIGMMVDLSHVSPEVMRQAIAHSRAPVIFSHSNARAINSHPRNVPDDVLNLLREKDGVVMVNFYPGFISEAVRRHSVERAAEEARLKGEYIGQPDRLKAALGAWDSAHAAPLARIEDVANHLDHIRRVAGIDHVGIGADFDGMGGAYVEGLNGVGTYPALFAELARRGWSDAHLAQLAGLNLLRVMRKAEQVAAASSDVPPMIATIEQSRATVAPASVSTAAAAVNPADDPFLGRWRLNKAKSTIGQDPGVTNKEFVFAPTADGITITETLELASENGKKRVSQLRYAYGIPTPQPGPGMDTFLVEKTGSDTALWTVQLKGKTLAKLQVAISNDGKEMAFRYLFAASDPTGKVTNDRYVYDKQ